MSSGGGGGGGNVPANTTQVQTIREAPEIEARRLGLMDAAKELAQKKTTPPAFRIAPMSTAETEALALARSGPAGAQMIADSATALSDARTAAGQTLAGNLALSATSGTATNAAVSGTEIVGAGVAAFSTTLSAALSITEIDINFNNTAGNFHVFEPNVSAPIANTALYARATTTVNADITAGRFTVELEYSVY